MFKESGYTGAILEAEVFDKIKKEKYRYELRDYKNFKESMRLVKDAQPYEDPSDPDPRFANDLHATVAEALHLEDYSKLRIYTAVGSHLDKYHSVDAFFEYDIGEDKVFVTFDVTSNPNKADSYRADIVFLMPPDGLDPTLEEDKEPYLEKINEVAKDTVNKLKEILNSKYLN